MIFKFPCTEFRFRHGRLFAGVTLLLLLAVAAQLIAADAESPVGKTFWLIPTDDAYDALNPLLFPEHSDFRRQLGRDIKWLKIIGLFGAGHYRIEIPDGTNDIMPSPKFIPC
jgi:hypothetical protein